MHAHQRYVLLMHIGAIDAEMMPRLLDLYRSKGFDFRTLPQAESDDFYHIDTDLGLPPAADRLENLMAERHLTPPNHKHPAVLFDSLCRS